jgi:monoamine oxidase
MARKLKGGVRLSQPVVRIEERSDGVTIICLTGQRLRADRVVCAMPFSMLRRIDVVPGFEGLQAEAIHGAAYAGTTHVILEAKEPFWERDGYGPTMFTDSPLERVFATADPDGRVRYLRVWVNGNGAERLDGLEGAALERFVLEELARLRPASRGKLKLRHAFSWSRHPTIAGHRHVFRPGEVTRFARVMGRPRGRLHLAGEHLRRLEFGMESACEAGERAALEILGVVD